MKEIWSPLQARKYAASVGMPVPHDVYATPNFLWQELLVNQKELPGLDVLDNLVKIAEVLEDYRVKYFHNSPIRITSGWRSESYNKNMKPAGAKNSYHIKGMALDFQVTGFSPQEVQKILDPVCKGGMEFAPAWTHCDIGPQRRFKP